MKQMLRTGMIVVGLVFSGVTAALPEIQSWTTDKGSRVLYVHASELPMVDIRLVFDGGSARDGEQSGIARLTNAMLDQGAAGLDAGEIAGGMEQRGAVLSGGSERDTAWLALRSLTDPELLEPALELFGKVISQPDFPPEDFAREQRRMLAGLQYQKQQPRSIASRAFFQRLYDEHPYASDPTGTEETVAALTVDEMEAFYRRYYVARNAVVVIVGDVPETQAREIAKRLADSLEAGEPAAALPAVDTLEAQQKVHLEHPSAQSHVMMGQPGLQRKDPDYFPLYVGNHILGGSGLVSRISEEIREERGLAYSAYSYFVPMERKGPYTFGFQTRNDQRDEALSVLRETVKTFIAEGPTAQELDAAQKNIVAGFPMRVASNSKIAEYLAVIGFYDLPLDYLETFPDRVEAVTNNQIKDAYRRRVHPQNMVTVIVGGEAEAQSEL